ncbi:hypothetical protein BDW22DRAFT_429871 [Trametopsis cervina]|nr:hypothetical protein BDW22DRAFT_429871 [Trametopsis cervina]
MPQERMQASETESSYKTHLRKCSQENKYEHVYSSQYFLRGLGSCLVFTLQSYTRAGVSPLSQSEARRSQCAPGNDRSKDRFSPSSGRPGAELRPGTVLVPLNMAVNGRKQSKGLLRGPAFILIGKQGIHCTPKESTCILCMCRKDKDVGRQISDMHMTDHLRSKRGRAGKSCILAVRNQPPCKADSRRVRWHRHDQHLRAQDYTRAREYLGMM